MKKLKTIGLWILQVLGALIFVMSGFPKLLGQAGWPDRFAAWGYPEGFYLLIGVVEVAGGIALLIPRFAGYGAVSLAVVMLGAFLTHWAHSEFLQVRFTAGVFLVFCLLAYARLPRPFLPRRRSVEAE